MINTSLEEQAKKSSIYCLISESIEVHPDWASDFFEAVSAGLANAAERIDKRNGLINLVLKLIPEKEREKALVKLSPEARAQMGFPNFEEQGLLKILNPPPSPTYSQSGE